ncbi:imidazole glycerol phosphate synthase subunit HisH [Peredibacter starrii]|uniref:Imidazole glycerol phosphate synthase subunit HisH n=1 Tax=Peredibacter starrii TaxID=28202 RepID=A0AAX4HS49_9BACT|nr:imidazole glycerol phosphate synthase subunit HisH [Peredibacter starrii]WPU65835.1 imidazole glycerol phosphate synthase subunit HisH [Peredibacter starrii]
MKEIGVIDYGSGNFGSVWNALSKLDVKLHKVSSSEQLLNCSHIVLPGVGAYSAAMSQLNKMGIVEALSEEVLKKGKPFLGICVGMQILSKKGFEHGEHEGLGWIDSEVHKLDVAEYPLPHIGWNSIVNGLEASPLTKNFDQDASFYFVHSYFMKIKDSACVIAESVYSQRFTSIVSKNNIHGVQFHPEKSQFYGLKLLENFTELKC